MLSQTTQPGPLFSVGYGDAHIEASGPWMGAFDRRVFAACLELFRDDPLLTNGKSNEKQLTVYAFMQVLRVGYGVDMHQAVLTSLARLKSSSVIVTVKDTPYYVPTLVNSTVRTTGRLLGKDVLSVAIPEQVANLYGRALWSAVPRAALDAGKGIKSWLASFYSSHAKPYPIALNRLHELSGFKGALADFRIKLNKAIDALAELPEEDAARIAGNAGADVNTVEVHLANWATWPTAISNS
ncbi:hypothetical protein SNE35_09735 [Paucibacter sp. R3-3]|uniref:Uncharacterized protein n=1 Tax=Roseateles agri TaxID=3098619 RepID=A0ABU5DF64_9BURK|nr:hypothetical protein [Paucibacter sp. R3-3]MDY0744789.1 hypothetical protein [Paucibacter sp. R3-3]